MEKPEKDKEEYIKQEYAPDTKIIQLSMLADEYIEKMTRPQNG